MPNPPRPTQTETQQKTRISYRVSVGLIALSLSLVSLSLGVALLTSPLPGAFLIPVAIESTTPPTTATAVTLNWTAPGDDGNTGQASSYSIRYSSQPITAGNFALATTAPNPPLPQPAGSTEAYTVSNLQPNTTYYFAVKATDEAGNISDISNVATKTTSAQSQACVPTYQCGDWSDCRNGSKTRTCTVTNNCPAGLGQPITTQTCTAPATAGIPTGGDTPRLLQHVLAAVTAPGVVTKVRIVNPVTKKVEHEILPFGQKVKSGAEVAVGDVDGDHLADIAVGSGSNAAPRVQLYTKSGRLLTSFNPYPATKKTGVSVALGDVDGDGRDELLTVPTNIAAQVRVFSYDRARRRFVSVTQTFAFPQHVLSGFSIATGDLNLDGRFDAVVAARTNTGVVQVLEFTSARRLVKRAKFRAYPIAFRSGITLAIGDVNGDGRGDIITTGGPGYYSHIKVFDRLGRKLTDFLPAATSFTNGFSLTSFDVDRNGRDEILAGVYRNGNPEVRVFQYNALTSKVGRTASYLAYPRTMRAGLRLGGE